MHTGLNYQEDLLATLDGLLSGEIPATGFIDQPPQTRSALMNGLAAAFGLTTLLGREAARKHLADIPARLQSGEFDGSFAIPDAQGKPRRVVFQGQLRGEDNGLVVPKDSLDLAAAYVLVVFDHSLKNAEIAGWLPGSEIPGALL